jgi:hypothetical protein
MGKKLGLSFIVLVIAGCLLLSAGLIAGAYFLLKSQKNYTPPVSTAGPVLTVEQQMDQIQQEVLATRGLALKNDLKRDLLSPADLEQKVVTEFFKDYTAEDAKDDAVVLSTFGLLEPGFDLIQFYKELYSEQIAGYYDSETKEMYVISGGAFGGTERMTYSHEFTHVLQDQTWDLENGLKLNTDYCKNETEYCAAVTALIEGDASLSEQKWFFKNGTDQDRQEITQFQQSYSSPVYDSAPEYMKQDFLFPYIQGQKFVESLFNKGSWQAVDAAYTALPVSTEQILHPEKYPEDVPVKVEMPDFTPLLGGDWREIDRNVMGEWYSSLVLSYGRSASFRLDTTTSETAAAGWGGDTYVEYSSQSDGKTLMVWHSIWDTANDADEFFTASVDYAKMRWGIPSAQSETSVNWDSASDGAILMRKKGSDVLWVIGSDKTLTDLALNQLPEFGN